MHGTSERLRERGGSGLLCIACRYDLSATIEVGIEKCPECGWLIDVSAIDRQSDPVTYIAQKRWYLPLGVMSPTVWTIAAFAIAATLNALSASPSITRIRVFQISAAVCLLSCAIWGWNQTAWARDSIWLRVSSTAVAGAFAAILNIAALFVVAFLLALAAAVVLSP